MHKLKTMLAAALLGGAILATAPQTAQAQGRGHGPKSAPGQAKKVASPERAMSVTREVLVSQGYEVVRVEQLSGTQVVYYRRGNMGRGRGKGPLMKMIVRPTPDRIVFEQAPAKALLEINVKLGQ